MNRPHFTFTQKSRQLFVVAALIAIMVLGGLLRIWRIDSAPKGALIDELHFGYLAYSLIETGKDEHGQPWPVIFRGFGDEKLPAMAYLNIPSVATLGLSLVAIRVPSVIAGTVLIAALFWLSRELGFSRRVALLGALITAVSPWSFFLSRFGFESNIALLFFTLGLAALVRAIRTSRMQWHIIAGVLMGLTWYSYIAYRPITVGILVLLYGFLAVRKELTKVTPISLAALAVVVLPLFHPSVLGANSARLEQVGVTANNTLTQVVEENLRFCATSLPTVVCKIAFNEPVLAARKVMQYYLESFSPAFLVSTGEGKESFLTVDGYGQFYPFYYVFFILGLVAFVLQFSSKKPSIPKSLLFLVIIGLLLAPIPTALVGDPQKVRISALYPFVTVILLLGVQLFLSWIPKIQLKSLTILTLMGVTLLFSCFYFLEFFGVHTKKNGFKYQSYVPDMVAYVETLPEDTIINLEPVYSDPLMFYAFYSKMDPREYQEKAVLGELEPGGFQHTVELGHIQAYKNSIHQVGCKGQLAKKDAVYITTSFIPNATILYEGRSQNGVHVEIYAYDADHFVRDLNCSEDGK